MVGISTGVVDFLTVFSTDGDIRETSAFPSGVFSVGALDSMHTGRRFIRLPLRGNINTYLLAFSLRPMLLESLELPVLQAE